MKCGALNPGSCLSGSSLSQSILLKESGQSCFAKRTYDGVLSSLMMLVCQTLHDRSKSVMLKFLLKFLIRLFSTALMLTFVY